MLCCLLCVSRICTHLDHGTPPLSLPSCTCAHTCTHMLLTLQGFHTIHLKGEDVKNLRETVVELIEPTSKGQGAPLKFLATLALSLNIQARAKNAKNVNQLVVQVSWALQWKSSTLITSGTSSPIGDMHELSPLCRQMMIHT